MCKSDKPGQISPFNQCWQAARGLGPCATTCTDDLHPLADEAHSNYGRFAITLIRDMAYTTRLLDQQIDEAEWEQAWSQYLNGQAIEEDQREKMAGHQPQGMGRVVSPRPAENQDQIEVTGRFSDE